MRKVFISKEYNPYFNIALENYLFNNASEDVWLYLWQNDKSVIIGRNQNLIAECDLNFLKDNNIYPVRRLSGGGAVYHDKGNLNFTIITKKEKANTDEYINYLKKVFRNLGFECEFSGRNDLLYQGKKFSGHAYYEEDGNYMYHGTIMINVDLNILTKALIPSKLKLESKGISSVRSRVINLSEVISDLTPKKVIDAFINQFKYDNIDYIGKDDINLPLKQKLESIDWLYGEAPKYNISLDKKYDTGNISINVLVENGLINEIKTSTDSLEILDFSKFEKELIGKRFTEELVWNELGKYLQ